MTSERFTNQLINAIKTGTTMKFREKYRNVDVLLIDDIHFIAGKEAAEVAVYQLAGGVGEVTQLEPGKGIDDVMQAGDDQDPVQEPVDQKPQLARANDGATGRVDAAIDGVVAQADQHGHHQAACLERAGRQAAFILQHHDADRGDRLRHRIDAKQ